MAINRVKELWQRGEVAYGAWLSIPSSLSTEALARVGYDYVCIDLQHGLIDYPAAAEMLVAISGTGATPFVRVPANDPAAINRALDAGALGIIVPMIHSSDDAYQAISACRYPPDGIRSYGPVRASMTWGPDYFETANDLVLCVPMIETRQALEEIEAIISLPGLNAIYVGPNDLSLSMGLSPGPDNEGIYQDAYRAIIKSCLAHGIVAGIHGTADLAPKHVGNGYRMVTVSSDLGLLRRGGTLELAKAKQD
jgi:4-hydroxy-2-oxoheptanedioate aldolase